MITFTLRFCDKAYLTNVKIENNSPLKVAFFKQLQLQFKFHADILVFWMTSSDQDFLDIATPTSSENLSVVPPK